MRSTSRSHRPHAYRGTSLIRTPPPVGPYRCPVPRGVGVSYERGTQEMMDKEGEQVDESAVLFLDTDTFDAEVLISDNVLIKWFL